MLAIDFLWPAAQGEAGWWNDMQTRIWLHNLLQELHRGTILFGIPGHVLGFLTGASLTFLAVTGIQMYLKMLKRQKKAGRSGLFWKTGTGMRRYHRWMSTIVAVFVLYIAATGTVTSFVQFLDPAAVAPVGGPGGPPPAGGGPEAAGGPGAPPPGGGPEASGGPGSQPPPGGSGGPEGGPPAPPEPSSPIVALSGELQHWHKGEIAGKPGQWIVLAAGFVFLALAITGALMYLDMWRNRRKQGRSGLFWS